MRGFVHLLRHADGNMRVDFRGREFRVPEHLLDETLTADQSGSQ